MEPWLALIGPGAGRRKGAVKRDEDAGEGRGWRERAGASGEEALVKSEEEERELGESERAGVSGEEEQGAAKVVGRKEGDREGFARSLFSELRCCLLYGLYLGLLGFPATLSLCLLLEMCCFSWISEFTWTSQIWQWKVLFCRPDPFSPVALPFFSLAPGRG